MYFHIEVLYKDDASPIINQSGKIVYSEGHRKELPKSNPTG